MSITVRDNADRNRFEAYDDSELLGFIDYVRSASLVVYPHTEVDPAHEGQGVGSALARAALDDARQRDLPVLPTCPFIARWMNRHPEYEDLAYQNQSKAAD